MPKELAKLRYFKKSNYEIETDKVFNNLHRRLWDDYGYTTVYYLGIIDQLRAMAKNLKSGCLKQNDILRLINYLKTTEEVPNEIKNLVDIVLNEFDYKEN
jgi:hypothetical protein